MDQKLSNARSKHLAELLHKKHRWERQRFLIEGVRCCTDLLNSDLQIESLFYSEYLLRNSAGRNIVDIARERKIELYSAGEDMLSRMSDTCQHQGVIACATMRDHKVDKNFWHGDRFLVLVDIADPGNVGTLLRTAEAFAWDGVLCVGSTVELYNPKLVRASMGSLFRLRIGECDLATAMSCFEYTGVHCCITMPHTGIVPPFDDVPARLALLLGNEAHGLPNELEHKADLILRLPIAPRVESLNVAICGSIFLFLLRPHK